MLKNLVYFVWIIGFIVVIGEARANQFRKVEASHERCIGYPERAKKLAELYGDSVKASDTEKQVIFRSLSAIADHYLEWYFNKLKGEFIVTTEIPKDLAGKYSVQGRRILLSKDQFSGIKVEFVSLVVVHEYAHALHLAYFDERFDRELKRIYKYVTSEGNNPPKEVQNVSEDVRTYAKTNELEYFAEFATSYLCKPKTREILERDFPKTYSFIDSYLRPVSYQQK